MATNVTTAIGQIDKYEKYKTKYKLLKRQIKETVFINAAYCDKIVYTEEKIQKLQTQISILLQKLLEKQVVAELVSKQQTNPRQALTSGSVRSQLRNPMSRDARKLLGGIGQRKQNAKLASIRSKQRKPVSVAGHKRQVKDKSRTGTSATKLNTKRSIKSVKRLPTKQSTPIDMERPSFPIHLDDLTVFSLGEVPDKPGFVTADHVYPAGFCTLRDFASIRDAMSKSSYLCRILDSATGPQFEIVCNVSSLCFSGPSPSACYTDLLRMVNLARQGKEQLPIASKGEDFFGLTHSLVQTLLHKLKSVSQPTSTATVSKTSSTDPCVSWEAYRARYLQ